MRYSNPPAECDICQVTIGKKFYDAAVLTPRGRKWANVCPTCFHQYDGRLGMGCGREWVRQTNGDYIKTPWKKE